MEKFKKIEQKIILVLRRNKYIFKLARFIGTPIRVILYRTLIFNKNFTIKNFNKNLKLLTIKKQTRIFMLEIKVLYLILM